MQDGFRKSSCDHCWGMGGHHWTMSLEADSGLSCPEGLSLGTGPTPAIKFTSSTMQRFLSTVQEVLTQPTTTRFHMIENCSCSFHTSFLSQSCCYQWGRGSALIILMPLHDPRLIWSAWPACICSCCPVLALLLHFLGEHLNMISDLYK
jgi:hypothetical protein